MPVTYEFSAKIEGHVDQVPMFQTPIRQPDIKLTQAFAKLFKMDGDIVDEGAMFAIRGKDSILHHFHASDSMRWMSGMHQSACGKDVLKISDAKELQGIADKFLTANGLSDKRSGFSSVVFGQASGPDGRPVNRCAYVNYTYALANLPLFGPGAKVQVTIGADGKAIGCYKFWREVKQGDEKRKNMAVPDIERTILNFPGFAQIKSGKVVVERARMGYWTLPPSDIQGALIPVVEFRGHVATREIEKSDFIHSLITVDYTDEEIKKYNVFNKHFKGTCKVL
jgi:hypothetical protein